MHCPQHTSAGGMAPSASLSPTRRPAASTPCSGRHGAKACQLTGSAAVQCPHGRVVQDLPHAVTAAIRANEAVCCGAPHIPPSQHPPAQPFSQRVIPSIRCSVHAGDDRRLATRQNAGGAGDAGAATGRQRQGHKCAAGRVSAVARRRCLTTPAAHDASAGRGRPEGRRDRPADAEHPASLAQHVGRSGGLAPAGRFLPCRPVR